LEQQVTEVKRMCLFVPERPCDIDVDEIPLEVCKLCLEAWKVHVSNLTIKRASWSPLRVSLEKGS